MTTTHNVCLPVYYKKNYMAVMRGFAIDRQDKAGQGS